MGKALQIVNWGLFEKADSRKVTTMQWVGVPINHSGLSYLEIMSRPDGVRTIGGWLLILQLAAQCPKRGLLVSDSGRLIGAREIALKTRANEDDIRSCIAILIEVGWIEEVDVSGCRPDNVRTPSRLQDKTRQDKQDRSSAEDEKKINDQIEDIFAKDAMTAQKIAAEPRAPSWLDWRLEKCIGFNRTGEDGDTDAWKHLFKVYGPECMDAMYQHILKTLPAGKKIWFSQAAEWLAANTKEVP